MEYRLTDAKRKGWQRHLALPSFSLGCIATYKELFSYPNTHISPQLIFQDVV